MIKKLFTFLCLCTLCIGSAWGAKSYTELFTIKSADVVRSQTYQAYTATVDNRGWIITFGGNNISVGTNSSKRASCKLLAYSKYAVKPVTTSDIASAFVSTTSISNVSKISFTISGGSNQTSTDVYPIYSADGNTFAALSSADDSQLSASIVEGTNEYNFEFASGLTGYFGLLFKATNSSGNWRIDDVNMTFYEESATPSKVLTSIAISGRPTKTTYEAGEAFDPTGLTVTGTYDDESQAEITSGITWNVTPSPLTAGTTSVSVTATVGDITSAAYQVNGLTVTAALPKITITADKIASFASSYAEYTWTTNDVSGKCWAYRGGSSGSYNIQFNKTTYVYNTTAVPGRITSIKMTKVDGTTRSWSVYGADEALTKENYTTAGTLIGSTQEVSSETGTTWNVPNDKNYTYFYITKADGGTNIGEIVITYEEDKTPTIEADVEKIEFEQKELDGTVTDNKTISATGKNLTAAISASMKSSSDAVFSVTPVGTPTATAGEFTVSYSTTEAGEYAGTVVLSSGETSIEIPVSASVVGHIPVLISIAVSGTPTKTEYNEGESFDPAGLVVTGTYDVGEPQVITEGIEWVIDPETFETAGTVSVEVLASVGSITSEVYTVDNIKVVEIPYIFYESFNQTSGTGGNDNQWSGQIASNTLASDNEGWSFVKQGGANKCAKFGSGNDKGSATTPALGYAGDAVISFKAAAWDGAYEGTTLKISVEDGGTVSPSSVTLVKGVWSTYQVSLTNLTIDSKIKFEAANASNNRFFLDEIMIVKAGASNEVAISSVGWATVCLPFKATITSGNATAYYVTGTEGNALTKEEASVIPAGEGVLLKSNNGGEATVTFTLSTETADAVTGNMMVGSLTDKTFNEENTTYYILTLGNDDKVGFYWDWETNNSGASAKCPAGKAVLAVPNSSTQAKAFFSLDDEPNGIEDVRSSRLNVQSSIYNLNGVRVNGNYKGIVIIDGKKFMNK